MLGHNRGHEVGNPFRGCRGTQTPSGGRCAPAGARGVLASFPYPRLPPQAAQERYLRSYDKRKKEPDASARPWDYLLVRLTTSTNLRTMSM